MKLFRIVSLICTALLASYQLSFGWTGKVVSVTDGDTIKVLHDGKQVKVRLYSVDTPEKKQAYGQKAAKLTSALVAGKTVDVSVIDKDRYGRSVGLVTVGSKNINRTLVETGYSWV